MRAAPLLGGHPESIYCLTPQITVSRCFPKALSPLGGKAEVPVHSVAFNKTFLSPGLTFLFVHEGVEWMRLS